MTGATVRIDGLKSKPECNGQCGVLLSFNSANGRWGVRLEKQEMALKPEALTVTSSDIGAAARAVSALALLEGLELIDFGPLVDQIVAAVCSALKVRPFG